MNIDIKNTIKTEVVSSMDLSSDSKFLATVTRKPVSTSSKFEYILTTYHPQKLEKVKSVSIYQSYDEATHWVKIAPFRQLIAVSGKFFIYFFKLDTLELLRKEPHKMKVINYISFSGDGKLLGVCGNGTILWDTDFFEQFFLPFNSNIWFQFIEFSKIKRRIFLISQHQIIYFTYTFQSNSVTFKLEDRISLPHSFIATSIDSSPTKSEEVVIGFNSLEPHLFSVKDRAFFKINNKFQPFFENNLKFVKYFGDGKRFISGDSRGLSVWSSSFLYYFTHINHKNMIDPSGKFLYNFLWEKVSIFAISVLCDDSTYKASCSCPNKQTWSYQLQKCIKLTCLDPNSTGKVKNNSCECKKGYQFNSLTLKCQFNCDTVLRAFRYNYDVNECGCPKHYLWNNHKCQLIPCSEIQHTDGKNGDGENCKCLEGFQWDIASRKCKCPKYQTISEGICVCIENYQRNQKNTQCQINCTTVKLQNSKSYNLNSKQCECYPNYYFTIVEGTPFCMKNCSSVEHAVAGIDNARGTCDCEEHFYWSENQCMVNCFTASQLKIFTNNTSLCECPVDYLWREDIAECSRNCSGIKFAVIEGSTNNQCQCVKYFDWNYDLKVCEINCDNFQKVVGVGKNSSICQCRHGYSWNSSQYTCQLNCSQINDGFDPADGGNCECKNGKIYNEIVGACEYPESQSFIFGNVWVIVGLIAAGLIVLTIIGAVLGYCCCDGKYKKKQRVKRKRERRRDFEVDEGVMETEKRIKKSTWKNVVSTKTNI